MSHPPFDKSIIPSFLGHLKLGKHISVWGDFMIK